MTPTWRLYRFARQARGSLDWQRGLYWYRAAEEWLGKLAAAHGLELSQCAGVVAALSPQVSWQIQLDHTGRFLSAERAKPGSGRFAGFNANHNKARRILRGEPADRVLGGDKVRAFWRALQGDQRAVVIDRHMAAMMQLGPRLYRARGYGEAVEAVWRVAARLGWPPREVQAACWCAWRANPLNEE